MSSEIDLNLCVSIGLEHQPSRLTPENLYQRELINRLQLTSQDWTNPYGRGYAYEFYLCDDDSYSMIVRISALVPLASVFFARRISRANGYKDVLDQEALGASHLHTESALKKKQREANELLRSKGYNVIAYECLTWTPEGANGKTISELVFDDPED